MVNDKSTDLSGQDKVNEKGYNDYLNGVEEEPIKDYSEILDEEREKHPKKTKITDTIDKIIYMSISFIFAFLVMYIALLFIVEVVLIIVENVYFKIPSKEFVSTYPIVITVISLILTPFIGKKVYEKKVKEYRRSLHR